MFNGNQNEFQQRDLEGAIQLRKKGRVGAKLTKTHSNLSSISNSAEHSGQDVLPGLASIPWLRQNGHFRIS